MIERYNISFLSGGETCAGWFFRGSNRKNAPCVILGHGFCGVKEMRLDAYAERFARHGFNALVFDYRHFGQSGGNPRQILDIGKQLDDWRSAINYARTLPENAAEKLILWGTSFSGGHVLSIATEDNRVAAVISQVPFMDGFQTALAGGLMNTGRLALAAAQDLMRSALNLSPHYVPAFGMPGDLAAMTAPGDAEAAGKLYPAEIPVDKRVAARIFLSLSLYSPGNSANKLRVPWLVQVASRDQTTPPGPAIAAAKAAPRAELIQYDLGHFDVYVPPAFERVITDQVEFLQRHFGKLE